MEVLKSGDAPALVSNLEVMSLLQERMDARQSAETTANNGSDGNTNTNKKGGPFKNRDWIEQAVFDYLKSSPCGSGVNLEEMPSLVERLRRDPSRNTSGTDIQQGYGLTSAETLQVLNHLPTSLVELHVLIEDLENRPGLSYEGVEGSGEEKQTKFLEMISQFVGKEVDGTAVDREGEEDAENAEMGVKDEPDAMEE